MPRWASASVSDTLTRVRRFTRVLAARSRRAPADVNHSGVVSTSGEQMGDRLRILHVSDLHERVALEGMTEQRRTKVRLTANGRHRVLGESFQHRLRELAREQRPDLICFTGDLADWGLPEEFRQAQGRLEVIMQTLGVGSERLFLVPGNHDVQRPIHSQSWRAMREFASSGSDNARRVGAWLAGGPVPTGAMPAWKDEVLQRTRAFWDWVGNDLGRKDLLPSSSEHGSLGYRVTLPGTPTPVHVIGLDSSWLCGSDSDAKHLCVTRHQVDQLCTNGGQSLPGFRLALVHHPVDEWQDAHECRGLLAANTDLLLHGHQHVPSASDNIDAASNTLRVIAAGSLYEGDEGDRYVNSFHVIDVVLAPDGRPTSYEVTFWGWSTYGAGFWHRTSALYPNATDGRIVWPVRQTLHHSQTARSTRSVVSASTRLKVYGSGTVIRSLLQPLEPWLNAEASIGLDCEDVGSLKAVIALQRDWANLAVKYNRLETGELSDDDLAQLRGFHIVEVPLASDELAFYVNPANPITCVRKGQLQKMLFECRPTTWGDLDPQAPASWKSRGVYLVLTKDGLSGMRREVELALRPGPGRRILAEGNESLRERGRPSMEETVATRIDALSPFSCTQARGSVRALQVLDDDGITPFRMLARYWAYFLVDSETRLVPDAIGRLLLTLVGSSCARQIARHGLRAIDDDGRAFALKQFEPVDNSRYRMREEVPRRAIDGITILMACRTPEWTP